MSLTNRSYKLWPRHLNTPLPSLLTEFKTKLLSLRLCLHLYDFNSNDWTAPVFFFFGVLVGRHYVAHYCHHMDLHILTPSAALVPTLLPFIIIILIIELYIQCIGINGYSSPIIVLIAAPSYDITNLNKVCYSTQFMNFLLNIILWLIHSQQYNIIPQFFNM